jgi:putative transposase
MRGAEGALWEQFWARGYWVSTVGRDEVAVRRYIQEQEKEDQRLDQLALMPL